MAYDREFPYWDPEKFDLSSMLATVKQLEKDFGSLQIWSETSERTEVYCENVVVDYQINRI